MWSTKQKIHMEEVSDQSHISIMKVRDDQSIRLMENEQNPHNNSNNSSDEHCCESNNGTMCIPPSGKTRCASLGSSDELTRPRRKLIDYTVSNRASPVDGGDEHGKYCRRRPLTRSASIDEQKHSSSSRPLTLTTQPSCVLPSFSYLERVLPYAGSKSMQAYASGEEEERIDFFFKIQPRRSSESKMNELRAGFEKKPRLRSKSRLFGSFTENGEIRRSYTDLKELLLRQKEEEGGSSRSFGC